MLALLLSLIININIAPSTGCITVDFDCECAPPDAVIVLEVTDPVTHHLIDWQIFRICPYDPVKCCPHVGPFPHFDLHWEIWRASGTQPIEQGDAHL